MLEVRGRVLVIAGSDSGGGAGLQADIKTIAMLGGYAMTAVTAVTVQDTHGVHGVFPVPADVVRAQGRVVLNDIGADAIKIGMLGGADIVAVAAELIDAAGDAPAVVDPVISTSTTLARPGSRPLVSRAVTRTAPAAPWRRPPPRIWRWVCRWSERWRWPGTTFVAQSSTHRDSDRGTAP